MENQPKPGDIVFPLNMRRTALQSLKVRGVSIEGDPPQVILSVAFSAEFGDVKDAGDGYGLGVVARKWPQEVTL